VFVGLLDPNIQQHYRQFMEEALDDLRMMIESQLIDAIAKLTKEIVDLQGNIENLAGQVSCLREIYE
jgi:hypothetical protein